MPVAATSTHIDHQRYSGEEDDGDDPRWYQPRSSSPPSSFPFGAGSGVIHQSSSATMGSWGFDVNRSANGQTPSSFTSNNNHHSNNDHRTITRTPRRLDETLEDYNERPVDRPSMPPAPPQRFKLRTPTLSRHRTGNDFAVVDRLVLGPSRIVQSDYYPTDELSRQQPMPAGTQSRQSSTRSILRRRSKSIGDFGVPNAPTSPPPPLPSQPLTQSYHAQQYPERSRASPRTPQKTHAEQELMAWQNRMLQRFVGGARD